MNSKYSTSNQMLLLNYFHMHILKIQNSFSEKWHETRRPYTCFISIFASKKSIAQIYESALLPEGSILCISIRSIGFADLYESNGKQIKWNGFLFENWFRYFLRRATFFTVGCSQSTMLFQRVSFGMCMCTKQSIIQSILSL